MPVTRPAPELSAVLIIEDDEVIGRHLELGLSSHGYLATWARTGRAAIQLAGINPPAVALLDLGLPDIDGIDVARALRSAHPDLLLVILTARSDEIDIIVGLDAGADDYLVKPFTMTVLLARLRAHLRRHTPSPAEDSPIAVGDLVIDRAARRCLLQGQNLPLRPKEFELLAALASHLGCAVSRDDLMAQIWDENWFGSTKTLDVTMAALRKQVSSAVGNANASASAQLPTITTLRGHGYRMEMPPATAARKDSSSASGR
ncbi:MAG: response regulator transcription factor [Actinomycetota bacterium]|nr:response regulator transcription factor [Actinomycetota bacterium]